MQPVLFTLVFLLLPAVGWATHATGNDDSTTAGDRANCSASFQVDCPDEASDPIYSDSVAAPVGALAAGAVESVILIVILYGTLRSGVRSRARPERLATARQRSKLSPVIPDGQ